MPALSLQFKFILGTGTNTATSVAIPSASVANDGSNTFKSLKEKGDGYFGSSDGLHTVTYTVTPNFIGTLTTQATLATDPIETDWFTVNNSTINYPSFPVLATTTTTYLNFNGNFIWVRAVVQRSSDNPNGSVRFINYNH
jgi:hypothetical protein